MALSPSIPVHSLVQKAPFLHGLRPGKSLLTEDLGLQAKGESAEKKKKPGPHPHPYEIPKGGALKLAQTWESKGTSSPKGTGNFWRTLYPSEMGSWRRGLEAETKSK